jgi:hypothetical protein
LEILVHRAFFAAIEQGTASDDKDQRIAESQRMVGRLAMEPEMTKKGSRFMAALQTITNNSMI